MSLRKGNKRGIVGFEEQIRDGSGWVLILDESGYSSSTHRAEAVDVDPQFASLKEHSATARLGTLLQDEELEERREELRALGYFGASETEGQK